MSRLVAFSHTAFTKLFLHAKKKYFSLGSMRGTVSLKDFSAEEVDEIAGFLGIPSAQLARRGSVSLAQFEEQLATSSFAHLTLVALVEAVLGEQLQTKAQAEQEKVNAMQSFTESLRRIVSGCPQWLAQIEKRQPDSRFIWQQQETILAELECVANAITARLQNGQFERLPVFAQRTTGNPHAFDANTLAGKLLVHAAFSMSEETLMYPKTTEERVDLLATLQIVQDDLWNFVTCQGMFGFTGNAVHPVWQAAADSHSVLNMPMRELMHVTRVQPVAGEHVWVVENSSVASTLMDAHTTAPIICTHGQLRMASWRLLDLLDAHVSIYYSGDLDPEGLQIAQKIVNRYGERVQLWRMDVASYEQGKSELLTEERLAKLQAVTIVPEVIEQIRRQKKASYQEAWLSGMIRDMDETL